ncbi:MAG TPA: DUF4097 family beta strand repeat-containing protein [Gemmatimonadaceae bacterium]|nr:DUF4097 family beta strand repeat-containing protein [Gemmatimonadaceae bacterium]
MNTSAFFSRAWTAAVIVAAVPLHAQGRGIDTTFAFNKSGEVNLSLPVGDIRVTAWARDEVHVVASSDLGPISASFSPTRVRLEIRGHGMSRTGRARYDVTVPIGVRVSASAASGTINVSGTRSSLQLTTASGPITASDGEGRSEIETAAGHVTLQRFSGTTRVSAMSGSVTISDVTGDLELEDVHGTTRIDHADVANFRFEAVAGSLDFSGKLAASGKHSVETLSGGITFRFPADFGATLELESLRGVLEPGDFPITLRPASGTDRGRSSDRQEYSLNGGGARIAINTFSGSVALRKIGAPEKR